MNITKYAYPSAPSSSTVALGAEWAGQDAGVAGTARDTEWKG